MKRLLLILAIFALALGIAAALALGSCALDDGKTHIYLQRFFGECGAEYGGSTDVAKAEGYSINTDFGGHGVGRTMHGDPHVPNNGRPGRGLPLKPGLVIAIERWFLETTDRIFTDPDGWTLRSADGSRGAHSEHTIAVTDGDPIVLTQRG